MGMSGACLEGGVVVCIEGWEDVGGVEMCPPGPRMLARHQSGIMNHF